MFNSHLELVILDQVVYHCLCGKSFRKTNQAYKTVMQKQEVLTR